MKNDVLFYLYSTQNINQLLETFMKTQFKKLCLMTLTTILFICSLVANAGLLIDGGFEKGGIPDWQTEGQVFVESTLLTLVNDTQALKIFGNFSSQNLFSVASQLIAVDGTNFSIGDKIQLTGLIGHLSGDALVGINRAYIEVGFANSTTSDLVNLAQSAFLNANSTTDLFIEVTTPIIEIPDLVFGENIAFIRVAAVFFQEDPSALGAA
jgi:hypothetical protein